MIRIQNLSKKYGESVIFENASFTFPDKGLVCILGPSGCGKSTLLNLIAGFDSAYEGDILVHGSSLGKMNTAGLCAYRRDNIGFVFQNYHLISGYSALENILLATDAVGQSPEAGREKALELLQKLGLSDKANQKIETLSGGQKQRVAIARALVNNPSVILADEPTGALDRKSSNEIMELLGQMAENRLVIVITHDKKCAEYAKEVNTIQDGKLISEGNTGDLKEEERAVLKTKEVPKLPLWKRAYRNFKVHLRRYTAVAFAISIGVLCFTLSLSSGNIMKQSIADFEAKNTAFHNGYIKAEGNEEELFYILKKDTRLENIYAQYVIENVELEIEGQTAVMAEKYPMAKAVEKMSYGVMPRMGRNEIAVSPSLAAKYETNIQNLIGKTAEVIYDGKTYELTVSGIFNASYDDFFVSSDIEQTLYEGLSKEAYSVSYDVKEFEEIVSVSESLKEQKISSQNASAEVAAFLNTFQNLNRLFFVISVLIFAIGIFISAVLLVKQQSTRYHEAGLLSALGYTKGSIQKILLYENIGLAGISAMCSVVLIGIAMAISKITEISVIFSTGQIIGAFCLTAVLILGISFISSIRLIHTEPAQALRK